MCINRVNVAVRNIKFVLNGNGGELDSKISRKQLSYLSFSSIISGRSQITSFSVPGSPSSIVFSEE